MTHTHTHAYTEENKHIPTHMYTHTSLENMGGEGGVKDGGGEEDKMEDSREEQEVDGGDA